MIRALIRVATATLLMALVVAGAILSLRWWQASTAFESTDNAYVRGDTTFVSARVAGYAVEVAVDDNQRVEPYQTLVRIDPRDLAGAAEEAEALLKLREAALVEQAAQTERQRAQIVVAQANVRAADATAKRTGTDLERASQLLRSGAGTQVRSDDAVAADVVAQSTVAQREAELRFQEKQLDALSAQRVSLEANRNAAEVALRTARTRLEDSRIWSPIGGVVSARSVRVGEYVTIGMRLAAIVPTEGLWVEANFRETQLGRMRPGDRASLTVDALPGTALCGTVQSVAGASGSEFAVIPPDNATGNFTKIVRRFAVRITLDGDQPALDQVRIGMSVVPTVALESHIDGKPRDGAWWTRLPATGRGGSFSCGADGPVAPVPVQRRRLPDHPGLGPTN